MMDAYEWDDGDDGSRGRKKSNQNSVYNNSSNKSVYSTSSSINSSSHKKINHNTTDKYHKQGDDIEMSVMNDGSKGHLYDDRSRNSDYRSQASLHSKKSNQKSKHSGEDEEYDDDDDDEGSLRRRLNSHKNNSSESSGFNDSYSINKNRNNFHDGDSYNSSRQRNDYNYNNTQGNQFHDSSGTLGSDLEGVDDKAEREYLEAIKRDPQVLAQIRREKHASDSGGNCCTRCCRSIAKYCSQCYLPKFEFRGICACPHGRCYGIMGIMTAQGGLMMNLYVLGTCRFNRIKIVNPVTGEAIPGSERGYGFDARETNFGQQPDYRQCTYYPDDEKAEIYDGWIVGAKFFSYISAILGVIGFLILFSICSMAYSKSMFERWLFWGYIVAAITVAFSFLIFGSEFCQVNECRVADGCGWAISCFFFHLMAANTVKSFPEPKPKPNKDDPNRGPPTIDDVYDELYYDDESDKYPPPLPDGRLRGIVYNDEGQPEFDDGEDYFDDLGNFIDPERNNNDRRGNDDDDRYYEDGSEYTDASYDDDELEESEFDPNEEDYDTWKKRQDEKKAIRDERDKQKQLGTVDSSPDFLDSASPSNDIDNKQPQSQPPQSDGQLVPTTNSTPYYRGTQNDDDTVDRLNYYQPPPTTGHPQYGQEHLDDINDYEARDPRYIRPEDREFPLDDSQNQGNLGVGYEHLDDEDDSPAPTADFTETDSKDPKKSKASKVTLYGAPQRPPNITEPNRLRNDNDDDDDSNGPVFA